MNRFNTQLTSPTMIAPQNAAQNPLMWKGSDSLPATQLVSHSNSPFTTSATTSRVPAFDQPLAAGSVIPDTTQVATPRAAAETSTRSRNLMVQILRVIERRHSCYRPGRGAGRRGG